MRLSDVNMEIILTRDDGAELAHLQDAMDFSYVRKANNPGGFSIRFLGLDFDASLIDPARDRRVEFWYQAPSGRQQCDFTGLLRHRIIEVDDAGRTIYTLNGSGPLALLDQRIIPAPSGSAYSSKSGPADDVVKQFVRDNFTVAGYRGISSSYLAVHPNTNLAPTVYVEGHWQNVAKLAEDVAAMSEAAGTKLYYDFVLEGCAFVFQTFVHQRGADRREGFCARPVIFGLDFGNLELPRLEEDYTAVRQSIYASALGVGIDKGVVNYLPTTDTRSIFSFSELFVSVQADNALKATAEAHAAWAQNQQKVRFTGVLRDTLSTQYGYHWFFGDRVTVNAFGIQMDGCADTVQMSATEDGQLSITAQVEIVA